MTTPHDDDPILTTRDAAQLLGVAVSTTQLWMESGALPAWKTPGGHRRVRLSSVQHLLIQQDEETAAGAAECTSENAPLAQDASQRLAAPARSGLMESPPEEAFDRLARLAAQVTDCPIALVTLVSSQRQWRKACVGIDFTGMPRDCAFCSHALAAGAAFVVGDAGRDPRFAGNRLVTGEPHVRFYAGVPLTDADGLQLGILGVFDREPRRLREREMRALHELAAIASEEIARRAQAPA